MIHDREINRIVKRLNALEVRIARKGTHAVSNGARQDLQADLLAARAACAMASGRLKKYDAKLTKIKEVRSMMKATGLPQHEGNAK